MRTTNKTFTIPYIGMSHAHTGFSKIHNLRIIHIMSPPILFSSFFTCFTALYSEKVKTRKKRMEFKSFPSKFESKFMSLGFFNLGPVIRNRVFLTCQFLKMRTSEENYYQRSKLEKKVFLITVFTRKKVMLRAYVNVFKNRAALLLTTIFYARHTHLQVCMLYYEFHNSHARVSSSISFILFNFLITE